MVTVADLAAYSIRQDGAITVCDKARAAVVELIDQQAAIAKPKHRWWRFGS